MDVESSEAVNNKHTGSETKDITEAIKDVSIIDTDNILDKQKENTKDEKREQMSLDTVTDKASNRMTEDDTNQQLTRDKATLNVISEVWIHLLLLLLDIMGF